MIELLIGTVILSIVLGMVMQILVGTQQRYSQQRQLIEIQNNAVTGLDNLVRLIKTAGSNPQNIAMTPVNPDPDGNAQFDSIRVQGDWNPPDGFLTDSYEDVAFSTNGGVMMIQDTNDPNPVPFLEGISTMTFTYLDANGVPIADPVANAGDITLVRVVFQTQAIDGDSMTFSSSAAIRSRVN